MGEAKEVLWKKNTRAHVREILLKSNFNEFDFREEKTKTREDKRMVKLVFVQNCLFWTYIEKVNTFIFWCTIVPLDPHLIYTQ